jgi:hypothetical protein
VGEVSRIIKHDKPLSDADIRYLHVRGRHAEIERNKKKFAKGKEPQQDSAKAEAKQEPKSEGAQKLSLDQDIFEKVKGLSPDDLKVELAKHGLEVPKTEREQRITLAKWLQDHRDS